MEEIFKPIKDYQTYAISNLGNVMDLREEKIIPKYFQNSDMYYVVNIKNKFGYSTKKIHILVALHFIDNPNNLEEIDHIDRNRINNNINNLRWCSRSDNQINKLTNGKRPYKNIYYEEGKTKKNPYSCWRIIIQNKKLNYSKRYKTNEYSLQEVKKIRDDIYIQYELPILD